VGGEEGRGGEEGEGREGGRKGERDGRKKEGVGRGGGGSGAEGERRGTFQTLVYEVDMILLKQCTVLHCIREHNSVFHLGMAKEISNLPY